MADLDLLLRKRSLSRIQRKAAQALALNPRNSGLYIGATVTDTGATQPAVTSPTGYAFTDLTRGIFHITGGTISSASNTIIGSQSSASVKSSSLGRIAAKVYSRYLAVKVKPWTNPYRFIVDGKFISLAGITMAVTSGSTAQWALIDFGTRDEREVVVDVSANGGVYGFYTEPTGKCRPIDASDAVYGSFLGDSYVGGSGAAISSNNIAAQLGDRLGIYMQASPAGGTGWQTNNSSYNFIQRIQNGDIETFTYYPPDIMFLMGSYNDRNGGANVAAPVALGIQTLRGRHPGVPIIVFGVAPGSTGPSAGIIGAENAVAAGVLAAADPLTAFVPVSTDPAGAWITGTGTTAVTTGIGNSDWATDPDGVHPTDEGHAMLGQRYATGTLAALRAMAG